MGGISLCGAEERHYSQFTAGLEPTLRGEIDMIELRAAQQHRPRGAQGSVPVFGVAQDTER
jgi:hypothetical protein